MQYDKEFKLQALELSDEIGVKAAAEQLGIKYYTLADWRSQRKARGEGAFVGSGNKVMPLNEKDRRIKELEAELRVFIAQYNYQKLQSEMENIASPKWRKLQRIF